MACDVRQGTKRWRDDSAWGRLPSQILILIASAPWAMACDSVSAHTMQRTSRVCTLSSSFIGCHQDPAGAAWPCSTACPSSIPLPASEDLQFFPPLACDMRARIWPDFILLAHLIEAMALLFDPQPLRFPAERGSTICMQPRQPASQPENTSCAS